MEKIINNLTQQDKQSDIPNRDMIERFIELEKHDKLEGIYSNIPADVYNHQDFPALRSSVLKQIAKGNYYRYKTARRESSPELEFGTKFHSAMERTDWNMQELNVDERNKLILMRKNTLEHPRLQGIIEPSPKEYTFIWKYRGIHLRCRPDVWVQDQNLIIDYKTALDASPDNFQIAARKYGYKFSAAMYMKIMSALTGERIDTFMIVAVEKSPPFNIAIYAYYKEDCNEIMGDIDRAIDLYQEGINGKYMGYSKEVLRLRY